MNIVLLCGNIVKDSELQKTNSGVSYYRNTIAVRKEFKNANGDYETDFIKFICWDKSAEFFSKFVKKGDTLNIRGKLQTIKYEDKNGNKKEELEVVCDKAEFLKSAERKEEPIKSNQEEFEVDESQLPF